MGKVEVLQLPLLFVRLLDVPRYSLSSPERRRAVPSARPEILTDASFEQHWLQQSQGRVMQNSALLSEFILRLKILFLQPCLKKKTT